MSRKKYYSPALRRDLVTRLYYQAKALQLPMTVLTDRLVEQGLDQMSPLTQHPVVVHTQSEHQADRKSLAA